MIATRENLESDAPAQTSILFAHQMKFRTSAAASPLETLDSQELQRSEMIFRLEDLPLSANRNSMPATEEHQPGVVVEDEDHLHQMVVSAETCPPAPGLSEAHDARQKIMSSDLVDHDVAFTKDERDHHNGVAVAADELDHYLPGNDHDDAHVLLHAQTQYAVRLANLLGRAEDRPPPFPEDSQRTFDDPAVPAHDVPPNPAHAAMLLGDDIEVPPEDVEESAGDEDHRPAISPTTPEESPTRPADCSPPPMPTEAELRVMLDNLVEDEEEAASTPPVPWSEVMEKHNVGSFGKYSASALERSHGETQRRWIFCEE